MTYEEALKLLNDMQFKDEYQGKQEYADMLVKIKEALEKQIPKKTQDNDVVVCPLCNSKCDYGIPYTCYCCHCGQKLKKCDAILSIKEVNYHDIEIEIDGKETLRFDLCDKCFERFKKELKELIMGGKEK